MTQSEYQQLVEFLAPRFDDLGNRLGGVEGRLDSVENRLDSVENRLDSVEKRLTRVEVNLEENRHQIQAVAEGLTAFREQTTREFSTLRQEMADRFELQDAVVRDLSARMDR